MRVRAFDATIAALAVVPDGLASTKEFFEALADLADGVRGGEQHVQSRLPVPSDRMRCDLLRTPAGDELLRAKASVGARALWRKTAVAQFDYLVDGDR